MNANVERIISAVFRVDQNDVSFFHFFFSLKNFLTDLVLWSLLKLLTVPLMHHCDTYFYFIKEFDQMNIEDASVEDSLNEVSYLQSVPETSDGGATTTPNTLIPLPIGRGGVDWMRKLAAKYQNIRETYNSYKNDLPGIFLFFKISITILINFLLHSCNLKFAMKNSGNSYRIKQLKRFRYFATK